MQITKLAVRYFSDTSDLFHMHLLRWRERSEEDDHHRGDPVLQIDGTGMSERCNVQCYYDNIKLLDRRICFLWSVGTIGKKI